MHDRFSQDRGDAAPGRRRPHPRRVRVAESVYQRVDRDSGKPVAGKYEFTYRDATGRQVWQTAKGDTKADATQTAQTHCPLGAGLLPLGTAACRRVREPRHVWRQVEGSS